MTDKIEIPRDLLEELRDCAAECANYEMSRGRVAKEGRIESYRDTVDEVDDLLREPAQPDPVVTDEMMDAFWGKVEVTREGSILGLAYGIEAAMNARPVPSAPVPEGCTPADARVLRQANHALVDELAQYMQDADRYRLLRRGQNWSVINGIGDQLRADDLDAAIDAAIEAQKEGE